MLRPKRQSSTVPSSKLRLRGLGIDLISLKRIRDFVKSHPKEDLLRLFSLEEISATKGKRLTTIDFAKRWVAKEAFFKSLNQSWMGEDGFKKMSVRFLENNQFEISTVTSEEDKRTHARGCFFQNENWLGAEVILWNKIGDSCRR